MVIPIKLSQAMKTLYRSPAGTLVTIVLFMVVSFSFFSLTAEYAISAREFNNAVSRYRGTGTAEISPADNSRYYQLYPLYVYTDLRLSDRLLHNYRGVTRYQPLSARQVEEISALPHVTSVSARYMTAGVSDSLRRLDDGFYYYDFTARCVIAGTQSEVFYGNDKHGSASTVNTEWNHLSIDDWTLRFTQ